MNLFKGHGIKARIESKATDLLYFPEQCKQKIKGAYHKNGIKVYWWKKRINFGDLITPFLLQNFGYTPIYSKLQSADVVSTGSILNSLQSNYSGIILGSGLIHPKGLYEFNSATILAVRGELTKKCIKAPSSTLLGDPGLLIGEFIKEEKEEKENRYLLGFVPHYVDKNHPIITAYKQKYGDKILIIDVETGVNQVCSQINSCAHILSSSLHGLIIADSFGIPNSRLCLSNNIVGGNFKFDDYNSSLKASSNVTELKQNLSLKTLLGSTRLNSKDRIQELKGDLLHCFNQLKSSL